MKYGAVNVASQAPMNPIEAARPNVYDRSRCDGISPPESQAYVAMSPCKKVLERVFSTVEGYLHYS